MTIRSVLLSAACLVASATAYADEANTSIDADPILDMRLRAEQVNQDGLDDTTALTLRARFGVQSSFGDGWSALIEGEGVVALSHDYSDTIDNIPGKAIVADPETLELNRLQIGWKGDAGSATIGRQRIILDNARFIGNVGFRQNEQTFDAIRLGTKLHDTVEVDYVYIDGVRRIFGDDSPMGEFESDSHVVRLGAETPFGKVTGTALLLDFSNAPGASSQTYAATWSNAWTTSLGEISGRVELGQQSEYQNAGPQNNLGYQSAQVSLGREGVTATLGVDVLDAVAGQGFSTPLATLHAFQGWADVFLATPGTGLRDLRAGLKGKGKALFENAKPLSWAVIYHDFESDNGAVSFGNELDAVLRIPVNDRFSVEAKGAVFNGASGGPADRTKIWLALNARF